MKWVEKDALYSQSLAAYMDQQVHSMRKTQKELERYTD